MKTSRTVSVLVMVFITSVMSLTLQSSNILEPLDMTSRTNGWYAGLGAGTHNPATGNIYYGIGRHIFAATIDDPIVTDSMTHVYVHPEDETLTDSLPNVRLMNFRIINQELWFSYRRIVYRSSLPLDPSVSFDVNATIVFELPGENMTVTDYYYYDKILYVVSFENDQFYQPLNAEYFYIAPPTNSDVWIKRSNGEVTRFRNVSPINSWYPITVNGEVFGLILAGRLNYLGILDFSKNIIENVKTTGSKSLYSISAVIIENSDEYLMKVLCYYISASSYMQSTIALTPTGQYVEINTDIIVNFFDKDNSLLFDSVLDSDRNSIFLSWASPVLADPNTFRISQFDASENIELSRVNFIDSTDDIFLDFFTFGPHMVLIPEANLLVAGVGTTPTSFNDPHVAITAYQITDCDNLSCEECNSNPYCGGCHTTEGQLLENYNCVFYTECQNDSDFNFIEICPMVHPSPVSGSINGDTIVNVRVERPIFGNVLCEFDGVTTETIIMDPYLIRCLSPAHGISENITVSLITENSVYSTFSFDYYDCSNGASCSDCTTIGGECGICSTDLSCSDQKSCLDHITKSIDCPYLLKANIVYILPNDEIAVTVRNFDEMLEYKCAFDGAFFETATYVNGLITCSVPITLLSDTQLSIYAVTDGGEVVYSENSLTLYIFSDCSVLSLCETCEARSGCSYCSDNTCSSTCDTVATECPATLSINPHWAINTEVVLTYEVTGINPGTNITQIQFISLDGGTDTSCPATRISNTVTSICVITDAGIYMEYLISETNQVLQVVERYIYDCSEIDSCNECADTTGCYFQLDDDNAPYGGNCEIGTETDNIASCIKLDSIDPEFDTTIGQNPLNAQGLLFSTNEYATCSFGTLSTYTKVDANVISRSELSCTIPESSLPGEQFFWLESDSNYRSNYLPFTFIECSNYGECNECPLESGCLWCLGSCSPSITCTSGTPGSCPDILDISPSAIKYSDNIYFNITGTYFENLEYRCFFENDNFSEVYPAVRIQSDQLQCYHPVTLGIYNVSIKADIPERFIKNITYATYSSVEIFDCDPAASCRECRETENSNCGFCIGSNTACDSEISCRKTNTSNEISQWVSGSCTEIKTVSPQSSANPHDLLTVEIATNFSPATWSNVTLQCKITYDDAFSTVKNVEAYPAENGIDIECTLPNTDDVTIKQVDLVYRRVDITEQPLTTNIRVINCAQFETCERCTVQEFCGQCLASNTCSSNETCSGIWLEDSCPTLDSYISPSARKVVVSGVHIYEDLDNLVLFTGSIQLTDYVIENNEISFELDQSLSTSENIPFVLFLDNLQFTDNTIILDGVEIYRTRQTVTISIVIAVVALVSIVVGILMYIYIKNKLNDPYASLHVNLVKPDFNELVFGTDNEEQIYDVPGDNYAAFVESLFNYDNKTIFLSFVQSLSSSDVDKAAKNIVYLSETNGVTMDFLLEVIRLEIDSCEEEATIFRGNSLASKMFTTYARLIGSEYLFDTLALFVLQIELLDKRQEIKDKLNEGKNNEQSLFDFDLELDSNKLNQEDLVMLEANRYALELVSSKIFGSILGSIPQIPEEFKVVFSTVQEEMLGKFGETGRNSVYYAVGGLLYLRFIIPAIFTPQVYGILTDAPAQITQRKLVLVSKVIQSIANMVPPSKKEIHMQFMEDFIAKNIPKVRNFYDIILAEKPLLDIESAREIPSNVRANAGAVVYQIFSKNVNSLTKIIHEQMDEEEAKPYIHDINKIIEQYGEAPLKREIKRKKTKKN